MVLLAFSVQDQVEKYGAYVGIASFFGLALLSLLYFAQAREVRRLREWAGRSPERASELEERVVAQAESVRRVPPPARPPVPVPAQPVAAAATNGAHKLKPAEVAALAFARAAGVAEPPHPPKPVPQPVAVAAEAPPTEVAAGVVTADEPAVVPASGNGYGNGDVPAPATPAARRPEVRDAAAPLRATPPPRRPAPTPGRRPLSGPPPRRETSTRSVVLTGLLVVVVLVLVVFAGVKLLGGGGSGGTTAGKPQIPVVSPGATAKPGSGSKKTAKPAATPSRGTTSVAVLNGTPSEGLAANMKDRLLTSGYIDGNVSAANDPTNTSRAASAVLYKRGASAQGKDVARVLDIKDVKPIDAATQGVAPTKSVVVEIGADKSGN